MNKKRLIVALSIVLFVISIGFVYAASGVNICGVSYDCGANDGVCPETYGDDCCVPGGSIYWDPDCPSRGTCECCGDGSWDCTGKQSDYQRCANSGDIGNYKLAWEGCSSYYDPRFYCNNDKWYSCHTSCDWNHWVDVCQTGGDTDSGRCCDPSKGGTAKWSYCGDGNINTVCGEVCEGGTQTQGCGDCGSQSRSCSSSCSWNNWGSCTGQGECSSGDTQTQGCGDCGSQSRSCSSSCSWNNWGSCTGQGECSSGATQSQSCGNCGTQYRTCSNSCSWNNWGSCYNQGVCSPGATQSQDCGNCGTQYRTCTGSCSWGNYGGCTGEGVCSPGQTQSQGCGDCGSQSRSCTSSCAWGSYGGCTGQGVCSPGATQTQDCGNCGTQSRSCSSSCSWGNYGGCTGEGVCSPGSNSCSGYDYLTCKSDCAWQNNGCTVGKCSVACCSDTDCADTQYCNTNTRQCVAVPSCGDSSCTYITNHQCYKRSTSYVCSTTDHCSGAYYYDGYTCSTSGYCSVNYNIIGCCTNAGCGSGEFCDPNTYQCKADCTGDSRCWDIINNNCVYYPGQVCSQQDHCVGATYYDGYTCSNGYLCNVDYNAKGCCNDNGCADNQYCDLSTNTCRAVTCSGVSSCYSISNHKCDYYTSSTQCDSTFRCSGTGNDNYNKGGQNRCQGYCDGSGNCDYASNCQDCGTYTCPAWSSPYCELGDVYHDKTCRSKGCNAGSCYDNADYKEELVQDCGIYPCQNGQCGVKEVCNDNIDNDFDGHIDTRDSTCTRVTEAKFPTKITQNKAFVVTCGSTSENDCTGVRIINKATGASAGSCTHLGTWYRNVMGGMTSDRSTDFSCTINQPGIFTIKCFSPNKATCTSYGSPEESGTPPGSEEGGDSEVIPDVCSERNNQADCAYDGNCRWCPDDCVSQPGKWSGYNNGACIDISSNCNSYYCEADLNNDGNPSDKKCQAQCDADTITCPATICDDYCFDAYTLYKRNDVQNDCRLATDCTCTTYACGAPTSQPCGTTQCSDLYPHTTGSCQNPCVVQAGDDVCSTCSLTFPGDCSCETSWYNINANPSDGCEYYCAPLTPGTEICDNEDNDCDGQTDEGCDDDNDDYCDSSMTIVGIPNVCPNGGGDADDTNPDINPGATEICNDGIDNDVDDNNNNWDADPLTGIDCDDEDCRGKIGPGGMPCCKAVDPDCNGLTTGDCGETLCNTEVKECEVIQSPDVEATCNQVAVDLGYECADPLVSCQTQPQGNYNSYYCDFVSQDTRCADIDFDKACNTQTFRCDVDLCDPSALGGPCCYCHSECLNRVADNDPATWPNTNEECVKNGWWEDSRCQG